MHTLDDLQFMQSLDPEDMYGHIHDFPEQMESARGIGETWKVDKNQFVDVRNIVLAGMGGSAIGGDLLQSYLQNRLQIPFQVCRSYNLPEYVDDETLVIISSYSGNTEETLAMFADALERSAMLACVTTGGQVAEIADREGIVCARTPGGLQPRAALAYSFIPLLGLFETLGLVGEAAPDVSETILYLKDARKQLARETGAGGNLAKTLAIFCQEKVPLVYAGAGLLDPVAVRWRGQMSENGKSLAYSNTFPEMNHNELVGWSHLTEEQKDDFAVILLRDEEDSPRIKLRMDLFARLLIDKSVTVKDVASSGANRLARLFSLVQLGDFVSYYLSALNKVDPTPVEAIESLKLELAQA